MDEQRQQQINEAAEQFANAVRESYRTVAERGESAEQLNAQLTQQFYNAVINNLHAHTEETQQMSQELRDQQERQQEAAQSLTQAYMDFMNSLFSLYQGSAQAAESSTEEATRST